MIQKQPTASTPREHSAGLSNIADLLLRATDLYPCEGIYFLGDDALSPTCHTYPALLDETQRILGGLCRYAPGQDKNVVLLLEKFDDFIPAFWACVIGGYVPCPIVSTQGDWDHWAERLRHVNALLENPLFITTDTFKAPLPYSIISFNIKTLIASPPLQTMHRAHADDPAVLMLTSGSTGKAKAVVLTHGSILTALASKLEMHSGVYPKSAVLNWVAFDHVAALEMHLLPIYVGAAQYHLPAASIMADPLHLPRLIDHYRINAVFGPNFLLAQINAALQSSVVPQAQLQTDHWDLSCLVEIYSAGEALVVRTGQQFLKLLAPYGLPQTALCSVFGMTETFACCTCSDDFPGSNTEREFASVGRPAASKGVQMRIVDHEGAELPEGASGELQLRGSALFSHYYNDPEVTKAAFDAQGWFRTGDLARIEAGQLVLSR